MGSRVHRKRSWHNPSNQAQVRRERERCRIDTLKEGIDFDGGGGSGGERSLGAFTGGTKTMVMFLKFSSGSVRPRQIFRIWLVGVLFEQNFENVRRWRARGLEERFVEARLRSFDELRGNESAQSVMGWGVMEEKLMEGVR